MDPKRDLIARATEVRALTPEHPEYPHGLGRLSGTLPSVFVRGTWERRGWRVAIVGARGASDEGAAIAFELAAALARRGVEILSGLAKGIDAAAHRGALSVHGRTGAVLGTPLDRCYPPEHAELQQEVARSVGLLTERPPASTSTRGSFASRNRLLAALSDAVVVVEGRASSGALITARHARSMGRPVGAVPWSLWCELGAAPHALLHDGGATLVRGPEDVLALLPERGARPPAELALSTAPAPRPVPRSRVRGARRARAWVRAAAAREDAGAHAPGSLEARVLEALRDRPEPSDQIAMRAGASFPEVSAILLRFEIEGIVRREFGGRVRLATRLRFTRAEESGRGS